MEEKKIINTIFYDIWNLAKEFIFKPMSEDDWNVLIEEANKKSEDYRKYDKVIWKLYRDIYTAIENYAQERNKNNGNDRERNL